MVSLQSWKSSLSRELRRPVIQEIPALILTVAAMVVVYPFVRYWFGLVESRVFEPYPIGWLEPVFYAGALRVFDGLPVYGPPSVDYVAPIYGPGMSVVGGLLFKLFGPGYPVLRMFSLTCLAGLAAVMGAWVRRVTGSWLWIFIPAVLLLMLDKPMDYWFMRVNVDIPYLFFIFLALFLVHAWKWSAAPMICAGVSMALACLFKQNALVPAFALGLYLLIFDRGAFSYYFVSVACVLLPAAVVLHVTSDGWFLTVAGLIPAESVSKISVDFLGKIRGLSKWAFYSFVITVPLLASVDRGKRKFFWILVGTAFAFLSWRTFQKQGSGENCLLPILLLGIPTPFLLVAAVAGRFLDRDESRVKRAPVYKVDSVLMKRICGAVALAAMVVLIPGGDKTPPDVDDTAFPGFLSFETRIRDVAEGTTGPLFIGARPEILYETGRHPTFHQSPLYDGSYRTDFYDLKTFLSGPLSRHLWKRMVVWEYDDKSLINLIAKYYRREKSLGKDPLIGTPVSVWIPK